MQTKKLLYQRNSKQNLWELFVFLSMFFENGIFVLEENESESYSFGFHNLTWPVIDKREDNAKKKMFILARLQTKWASKICKF